MKNCFYESWSQRSRKLVYSLQWPPWVNAVNIKELLCNPFIGEVLENWCIELKWCSVTMIHNLNEWCDPVDEEFNSAHNLIVVARRWANFGEFEKCSTGEAYKNWKLIHAKVSFASSASSHMKDGTNVIVPGHACQPSWFLTIKFVQSQPHYTLTCSRGKKLKLNWAGQRCNNDSCSICFSVHTLPLFLHLNAARAWEEQNCLISATCGITFIPACSQSCKI